MGKTDQSAWVIDVIALLSGGDRRSIGRVPEVIDLVLHEPSIFDQVFAAMQHPDPVVRMRAADAVEKLTAINPAYLQPHTQELVDTIALSTQQEVRWHVAQMVSRVQLSPEQQATIVPILVDYLRDKSAIVKVSALQALADLAHQDESLRPTVIELIEEAIKAGSPALRSRGRKLYARLKQSQ